MQTFTISKAAHEAGVGVETVRFYERRGLIEQPEKPGHTGYRHYSAETVRRIRFIRKAQQIGFSLREIQELLWLRADPSADCSDVRQKAASKIDEVDEKIIELKKIRKALALKGCTILEALQDGDRLENQTGSTGTRRKIR